MAAELFRSKYLHMYKHMWGSSPELNVPLCFVEIQVEQDIRSTKKANGPTAPLLLVSRGSLKLVSTPLPIAKCYILAFSTQFLNYAMRPIPVSSIQEFNLNYVILFSM